MLMAGTGLGWYMVVLFEARRELAVGYALITAMLIIVGTITLFTDIMLHSIRGLLLDAAKNLRCDRG